MKLKVKGSPKRKPENIWQCCNCPNDPCFEHAAMMTHLKDVHGIDPKTTKGKRIMTLHLDAAETFTSNYEWTIGGLKFYQTVTCERDADDMMRWM